MNYGRVFGAIGAMIFCCEIARATAVEDYIEQTRSRSKLPGLSVAVVNNGSVVMAKGFGLADVELNVPATENTVYQWASVTKQFTATAIMLLVEEGKLRLEDAVSKHYPEAPKAWKDVTIRHLLNHTSGIRSVTDLPDFRKNLRKDYERGELIGQVKDMELDFAPGEKWRYNNTGYLLLGVIIEAVSGQSYADFLKARIFEPLGMSTARLNDQSEIIPNRATGYYVESNGLKRAVFVSPTQPYAAGALVGTVHDLAKWDAALYGDKLLPAKTRELMWQPTKLTDGKTSPYGYGWQLGSIRGHRYVAHGGGIDGFSTYILRLLEDKLTVIVLQNGNSISPQSMAEGIAAKYVPELSLASVTPGKDPHPDLSKRLRLCLDELVEKRDSEILTDSFRRNFSQSRRRHGIVQEHLKNLKEFTYLISEKPESDNSSSSQPVDRAISYKLVTKDGTYFYTFNLTAENKLANFQVIEQ